MSVSLQTYSQSTSLQITETPAATPAGGAEPAIDQLVLQVLEQVLKALQGAAQGGNGVGGHCGAGGTGGTRSADGQRNGPEGVLQRFAELLKHLGQALEKSLAAVRANAFANKLARALGSDARTLDRLDDGAEKRELPVPREGLPQEPGCALGQRRGQRLRPRGQRPWGWRR